MAGIDDDVRARLERRCEQALSEGGGEPGSGAASLAQWRGAVSGGGAALGASNPSRAADEPRELVELVKGELLARRQEELLSIIRETPGWGQSNIGKTGYLHVHDAPSSSEGAARESSEFTRRYAEVVGSCGEMTGLDAGVRSIEAQQGWRERYVVVTPGTLELYTKTKEGTAEGGSGTHRLSTVRRPSQRLRRTVHLKLANLVSLKPYVPKTAPVHPASAGAGEQASVAEAEPSSYFELVFNHAVDAWKMDYFYLRAESAAEAAEWIRLIKENKKTAVDATVVEDDERTQRLLDELELAFAELSAALNRWIEGIVLFPKALEILEGWCRTLNTEQCKTFERKQKELAGEPQSSVLWGIKPRFQSPTNWQAAIDCLNMMGVAEEPQLPSALEEHLLAAIDAIYDTFTAEHGREQVLGADDLFPIIIYAIVHAQEVPDLPVHIEMVQRMVDQSSKGAYYSITLYSAVQYIGQLERPVDTGSSEPEPELESVLEPQLKPELEPEPEPGLTLEVDSGRVNVTQETEGEASEGGDTAGLLDDGFMAIVESGTLAVQGRRRCTVGGLRLGIESDSGAQPAGASRQSGLSLDLGRPRTMLLTLPAKRAFMIIVEGSLSHFVVEDAAVISSVISSVKSEIADGAAGSSPHATEVVEPATPRLTSCADGNSTMVKLVFALADIDRDGFLNHSDCSELARRTDSPGGLPAKEYAQLCAKVQVEGEIGLLPRDLFCVYCKLGLGDLQKDFGLMKLDTPLPELILRATYHESKVEVAEGGAGVVCNDEMVVTKVTTGGACMAAHVKHGMQLVSFGGGGETIWTDVAGPMTWKDLKSMVGETARPWVFTFGFSKASDLQAKELLAAHSAVSDQASARTIAKQLLERLKLDINVVTLKSLRLLESLLKRAKQAGAGELHMAANTVCRAKVAELRFFGRQDPEGCPDNPGKPAALIKACAIRCFDLLSEPIPHAHDSPVARSSILRGTFMVADEQQETSDSDIDLFVGLVMEGLGMTEEAAAEMCSSMDITAKWDMIKAHADTVDFDKALFKRDLKNQILSELDQSSADPGAAHDVARRLAFCITCDELELRGHHDMLSMVSKELNVEVYGTDSAWNLEGGTKEFTQYRTNITLMGVTWSLNTRWSHLEALEKKLRQAFEALPKKERLGRRQLPTLRDATQQDSEGRMRRVGSSKLNIKSWVNKTNEGLVELRSAAASRYLQTLCEDPGALKTVKLLDFLLPKESHEVEEWAPLQRKSSQSGGSREELTATGIEDEADLEEEEDLPEPTELDASLLGDEPQFYTDNFAIDEQCIEATEMSTNQLIARLTSTRTQGSDGQDLAAEHHQFVKAFLATFRSLMTPLKLLAKIWQRSLVPCDGAEAVPLSKILTDQYLRDQAVLGSYVSVAAASDDAEVEEDADAGHRSTTQLLAMYVTTVNSRVLIALRQWILEYYAVDFHPDRALQASLLGFTQSLYARGFMEDSAELQTCWDRARRGYRASLMGDRSYLSFLRKEKSSQLNSTFSPMRGDVAHSSSRRKNKPPPPPILPSTIRLQVTSTRQALFDDSRRGQPTTVPIEAAMVCSFKLQKMSSQQDRLAVRHSWLDMQKRNARYAAEPIGTDGTELSLRRSDQLLEVTRGLSWFDLAPVEVARQLTLLDFAYFSQLCCHEIVGQRWLKTTEGGAADSTNPVRSCLQWGMDVTQWVVTTAVAPNDAATRAARLRLWIQVGEQLLKLSSFNIAMSVAAALQHTLVQALPEMQTLSPEDQRYQKELCQFSSPDDDFAHYQQLIASRRNQDRHMDGPILPVVPLMLHELVKINRAALKSRADRQALMNALDDPAHREAVGARAAEIYREVFVEVIETLPDIESTKQGSKRRELAELRLKLQAAREDVQQRAEGCSHTKVCELYQQQLEITHRMIEQVENQRVSNDVAPSFERVSKGARPVLDQLLSYESSRTTVDWQCMLDEWHEAKAMVDCQKCPYSLARVGLIADMVPCGPYAAVQLLGGGGELQLLPECELERVVSGRAITAAGQATSA